MKFRSNLVYKNLSAFLALIMALSWTPFQASAEVKSKVQIQIGKPSIWSLAQAHYLLAKMHKDNRNLSTHMPTEKDLDPNAINTTRIQLLRTLLDVEGQFNQKIGAENESKRREEQFALRRREEARAELESKQAELDSVNNDLRTLRRKLARKQVDFDQRERERLAKAKPKADPPVEAPLPDKEQNDLEREIKELNVQIASKEQERKDLQEDIGVVEDQANTPAAATGGTGSTPAASAGNAGSLRARANASVATPSFADVPLGNSASLPDFSTSLKDIITAAMRDAGKPSLAASIALDNFVGMQYEIIAKRLTLLRDEVGPDERVIFLELPSSIYTVPCKGDEYIAQVHWKVNWYYDDKQAEASMMDENIEDHTNIEDILNNKLELTKKLALLKKMREEALKGAQSNKSKNKNQKDTDEFEENVTEAEVNLLDQQILSVKRELMSISNKVDEEKWKPAVTSTVRALDVIPRQSALNVNDIQATVSQKNFLGVLKLLSGLGIRVSYQRQRELYEQYLQQEVFASGFGKGSNAFGWTFGALPGTNRVAPGVRTTYAVLAVPRQASALRIEATGVAYHRKSAPEYVLDERRYDPDSKQIVDRQQFIIRIPNEHTEQFKVISVAYSTVKAGEPITVVIKGDYFSPQIGVLVDGVPLARSLSVGNTEISDAGTDNVATSGVRGQYELVSSHEIVMKFSMGNDKYVGTPNITLITPEKSTAINYLPLQVNYRYPRISLRALASFEPMFIEPFSLKKEVDTSEDGKFIRARLTGTGLRSNAVITVNDREIPFFKDRKWKLIKEATERTKNEPVSKIKDLLYNLLQGQTEPGKGDVDQMIADILIQRNKDMIQAAKTNMERIKTEAEAAIERCKQNPTDDCKNSPSERKSFPDKKLIDKVVNNQGPYDKDVKRAVFLLFLTPPMEFPEQEHNNYQEQLKDAAYALYNDPQYDYLKDELIHEALIFNLAKKYADTVCLKNGARGNECTEASKRKVMQRRLQELLSDNVDPFHQDEPYHNDQLYQKLKEELLDAWVLLRKQYLREAFDAMQNQLRGQNKPASDKDVRNALVIRFASEEEENNQKIEKACRDSDKQEECRLAEAKKIIPDDEALYLAIKNHKSKTQGPLVADFNLRPVENAASIIPPPGFDEAKAREGALSEIAKIYENPADDEEYAKQESTSAYTVRFLGTAGKPLEIRYRQKTASGFDTGEIARSGEPAYKVVRYIPDVGGDKALVDVKFVVDKEKGASFSVINPHEAELLGCPIKDTSGAMRVSFEVKHQPNGNKKSEREHFWVSVTPGQSQPGCSSTSNTPQPGRAAGKNKGSGNVPPTVIAKNAESKNLDIEVPVKPRVTKIANSRTGKPEGYADEQPLITIYGYNLQTVAKVLFGDKESTIVGAPDYNSIVLRVPKTEPPTKGEAVEVPVVLVRTDGSQVASPLFYTYLGPPSPVVIYRPRRVAKAKRARVTESDETSYADPEQDEYDNAATRPRIVGRRRN